MTSLVRMIADDVYEDDFFPTKQKRPTRAHQKQQWLNSYEDDLYQEMMEFNEMLDDYGMDY